MSQQSHPLAWKLRSAEEVNAQLAGVQIHGDETLEGALRRFKRKVLQEDIIKEIKRTPFI